MKIPLGLQGRGFGLEKAYLEKTVLHGKLGDEPSYEFKGHLVGVDEGL